MTCTLGWRLLAPDQFTFLNEKVRAAACSLPHGWDEARATQWIDIDRPPFLPGERQLDVIPAFWAGEVCPFQITPTFFDEYQTLQQFC